MKYFYVGLITLSLISNSFAANLPPVLPSENLNVIVSTLNLKKYNYKDLVEYTKKADIKKAKEIEAFYSTHPDFQNAELPKASVEDGKIIFIMNGHKSTIQFDKSGMNFTVGNKTIFLESTLSVALLAATISEFLGRSKYSFFNFVINEANATDPFTASLAAVALVGVLFTWAVHKVNLANDFKEYIEGTKKWCEMFDGAQATDDMVKIYETTYNKLGDEFVRVCGPGLFVLKSKGYSGSACKALPEVKKCLKRKIDQMISVDSSSRSKVKSIEIQYNKDQDKYFSTNAEK